MLYAQHNSFNFSQKKNVPVVERIASWDLECMSHDQNKFPSPSNIRDCIELIVVSFSINEEHKNSYVILRAKHCTLEKRRKLRLLLQEAIPIALAIVSTEFEVLQTFHHVMVNVVKPTIIISFNGSGFDTPMIYERAKILSQQTNGLSFPIKTFAAKVFSETKRYDLYLPPAQKIDMFLEMRFKMQKDFQQNDVNESNNNSLNWFATKYLNDAKVNLDENILETTISLPTIWDMGTIASQERGTRAMRNFCNSLNIVSRIPFCWFVWLHASMLLLKKADGTRTQMSVCKSFHGWHHSTNAPSRV